MEIRHSHRQELAQGQPWGEQKGLREGRLRGTGRMGSRKERENGGEGIGGEREEGGNLAVGMFLPLLRLPGCSYVVTSGPGRGVRSRLEARQGLQRTRPHEAPGGGSPRVTWKAKLDVVAPRTKATGSHPPGL